ncbi:MAG: hypothetical protein NVS9B9_19730 [Ktedonobacteraceae bacterium]
MSKNMPPDYEKELVTMYADLKEMLKSGQITKPTFYKGVLCLAYEHATFSDYEDASALVKTIPEDYFFTEHIPQMKADEEFAEISEYLSKFLTKGQQASTSPKAVTINVPKAKGIN